MSQPSSNPSNFIEPKLGFVSIAVLALLLLGSFAHYRDYCRSIDGITTPPSEIVSYALVGQIYGWAASLCWILTAINRRYLRWVLQAAIVCLLAYGLSEMTGKDYRRFFSTLAGFVFIQSLLFHFLGIPSWRRSNPAATSVKNSVANTESDHRRLGQFGIGEIIASTTVLAILFATVDRYKPSDMRALEYWVPLISLWFILPLSFAGVAFAILKRQPIERTIACLIFSCLLTAACGAGLVICQVSITNRAVQLDLASQWDFVLWLTRIYETILLIALSIVSAMAILGRIQGVWERGNAKHRQNASQGFDAVNE